MIRYVGVDFSRLGVDFSRLGLVPPRHYGTFFYLILLRNKKGTTASSSFLFPTLNSHLKYQWILIMCISHWNVSLRGIEFLCAFCAENKKLWHFSVIGASYEIFGFVLFPNSRQYFSRKISICQRRDLIGVYIYMGCPQRKAYYITYFNCCPCAWNVQNHML